MVVNGEMSAWITVTGCRKAQFWGRSYIYINNLDTEMQSKVLKFADDTNCATEPTEKRTTEYYTEIWTLRQTGLEDGRWSLM